jgi:hypothetical protein
MLTADWQRGLAEISYLLQTTKQQLVITFTGTKTIVKYIHLHYNSLADKFKR